MKLARLALFPLILILVLGLALVGHFSSAAVRAVNLAQSQAAVVTIRLADLGLEFGAIEGWEASLYAGAVVGQETSGRFTAWKPVEAGTVVFQVPDDVSDGSQAPWDQVDNTYVRVRQAAPTVYPTLDLVSNSFTLVAGSYNVDVAFFSTTTSLPLVPGDTTEVRVYLDDLGGAFSSLDTWEASLYAGAEPGQETSGRFTAWKPVEAGLVTFRLPAEINEGSAAPWAVENGAYIRVRSTEAYPTFDLVGRPFTLVEGLNIESRLRLARDVQAPSPTAAITVTLTDLDLASGFGAVGDWEASLYTGAAVGQETSGRFTDWKPTVDGAVTFALPDEVNEGGVLPWGRPNDTYVRVRTVAGASVPVFDLVSDPFTLVSGEHAVAVALTSTAEAITAVADAHLAQTTNVTITLQDAGGIFGQFANWEASLYTGAVVGQETSGRFTAWKPVTGNAVTFALPDEVLAGNSVPWGEADNTYVRFRQTGVDVYPTFDLVGAPFTLNEGQSLSTSLNVSRAAAPPAQTATVLVTLADLGLAFGAVGPWEASLYMGAIDGQETSGRFTAWREPVDGVVTFTLPLDVNEGSSAPWGVSDDTYVRIRTIGASVFPTFDLASNPFTLVNGAYQVQASFTSFALLDTRITIRLEDQGGSFGQVGVWEASLYRGAVAGQETNGRFTAWQTVQDGVVTFSLPQAINPASSAPWGVVDDTYVRFRHVGDSVYPTFDLVGTPFTLTEGSNITTQLSISRRVSRGWFVYLPFGAR
ncbi:hypothetical protein [Candidatus Chloroploca sp. Khr17]|uniref:hypothetical protein n=1 Tax=Candidatus Chloroploca sp. Khr17 TaxID=2496869 RepID=UPI00101C881E|nr:hypothetical protein [Candidatus Chloroploca sp. Khr17]